ncbi:hypothetical protein [Ferrovibrio terrae]|uniref:hypothetical protein n=1 Tax=Ferrovibrio terrae TaxID=2594003 RepID=UPI0031383A2D
MIRLFLVLALLLSGIQQALACSRAPGMPEPTDEDLFREASAVFVARVYKTEEAIDNVGPRNSPVPIVIGTFRPGEIFKGRPPADNTVRDFTPGPGNCGLMLMAGVDYLFFLQEQTRNYVPWPHGSRGFFNINATEPQKLFEKLRTLK